MEKWGGRKIRIRRNSSRFSSTITKLLPSQKNARPHSPHLPALLQAAASTTAPSPSFFSLSFFFSPAAAAATGLLNTTVRCGLGTFILPPSIVGTVTFGAFSANPLWNVPGSTLPGGSWKVQFARVQAAPNLHGIVDPECA